VLSKIKEIEEIAAEGKQKSCNINETRNTIYLFKRMERGEIML